MFDKIDSNAEYNGQKVLKAFIDNRVSEGCLKGTTGYGYGDMGRDTIDKVFAQALGGEDALVRHTFVNGTHALSTALFGVLEAETQCLPALESHMILLKSDRYPSIQGVPGRIRSNLSSGGSS